MFGKGKKVVVVVPCDLRQVDTLFHDSLLGMAVYTCKKLEGSDIAFYRVNKKPIEMAKNIGVRKALELGADYICFIDSDMTVPRDMLERFMSVMKKNPNIDALSAVITNRIYPYAPLLYKLDGEGNEVLCGDLDEGVSEVDIFGTGVFIAKSRVFELVPPPWFKRILHPDGCGRFVCVSGYFCQKARHYGARLYVDATVKAGHVEHVARTYDDWEKLKEDDFQLRPSHVGSLVIGPDGEERVQVVRLVTQYGGNLKA